MVQQYYQEQVALGSVAQISLVDHNHAKITKLYRELWLMIFEFEKQFSRFLPSSELSLFNRNAGLKQPMSATFKDILLSAKQLSRTTKGIYNPFILPALQAAGYDHSLVKGHEHDANDSYAYRTVAPIEYLEIGRDWARIPHNTALDLGGCGKGYLADKLAATIHDRVQGYWVSLGGDVVCGGTDHNQQPWTVTIQAAIPEDGSEDIGIVSTDHSQPYAVATSGVTTRKGIKRGQLWHHLIDPRTLKPSTSSIRLATVCHQSALQADVLASCAVILGIKDGMQLLKQHSSLAALMQYEDQKGQINYQQFGHMITVDGMNQGKL